MALQMSPQNKNHAVQHISVLVVAVAVASIVRQRKMGHLTGEDGALAYVIYKHV